ncbi:hypothetical protein KZZ52_26335 [Dactylosporangium sp. AC04546]|uniref:PspA-associated protein PspAB n=1 Tax=Dactylosporangium sp. AC04546 TaxID=2862460 RepID=UPI001EDE6E81|nr:hypothetical protein [Dactylosporangium sp. AC04546]WVK88790.1 hypothetical protein KZZ52_26335 [Dactylosporangium sp. AC04546]
MRFLDALLGRTRPVQPNLDALFGVPAAATTLQAALDLVPTGVGAVCFKPAEGQAATQAQTDAVALLTADAAENVAVSQDEYGYTWIASRHESSDLAGLVTDLHAVNSTLADAGYGPSLLCTIIGFVGAADHRRLGLVYLFKRGTFYPFAPTGAHTRDNALELQTRAQLGGELPVETDLDRWFPIWTTPAL